MRIALSMTTATLLFAAASGAAFAQNGPNGSAPGARQREVGHIRGTVFDSLLMKPVSHATVMLMTSSRTITTDDKGNFGFDDVPVGTQSVAFTSPEIDSVGLGTLGTDITVTTGNTVRVTVATPSLATLWRLRCNDDNRVGRDSGIVWGTIHDAQSNSVVPNAAATFEWVDLKPSVKAGFSVERRSKQVGTTDLGFYFACGLPIGPAIASDARSTTAASGAVQYTIGARKLQRLDLMVSKDMVVADSAPKSAADSAAMLRARGNAIMRGIVFDAHRKPLVDATVSISTVDTSVVTDKDGRFQLGALPAGTHVAQAKRLGSNPASQVVQLRADTVTDVTIEVSSGVNTLSTVNVRAKGADRLEYEARRKAGIGHALEADLIAKRSDMYSVMTNFPGVTITRKAGGVDLRVSSGPRTCTPKAFLDGYPVPLETVTAMANSTFNAIELFEHSQDFPPQYGPPPPCAIFFWSKHARW